MRGGLRTTGLVAAILLGWLLVGPQHLGGPVATVSTYGDSMLPTYDENHLVLARRAPSYAVGDVIAYRSATLDGAVVLHRIVDVDEAGFVTQGDNNDWLDPDRPTSEGILGRAWVAIPHAGHLLSLPLAGRAGLVLLVLTGIAMTFPSARNRVRSARRRTHRTGARPAPATTSGPSPEMPTRTSSSGPPMPAAQLLTIGAIAVVVTGTFTVFVWSQPVREPGPVAHEQQAEFSYHADVDDETVYADGRIDTGDPVFLQLQDEITVEVDWSLTGEDVDEARGTGQLTALVADGSGWEASVPLGPATAWEGTEARLSGTLDFTRIQRLAARAGETTGVGGNSQTVTVTADIDIEGEVAATPFGTSFAPTLTFDLSELRATTRAASPAIPAEEGTGDDAEGTSPLVVTESGSVIVGGGAATHLSFAGRSLAVSVTRPLSVALLAVALGFTAGAFLLSRRTRGWDVHDHILARHGHAIIDVAGLSATHHGNTVAVPNLDQLVTVAEYRELPVLRVPLHNGGYGYVVDDVVTRYHHLVPQHHEPAPAPDAEQASDPPEPDALPPATFRDLQEGTPRPVPSR